MEKTYWFGRVDEALWYVRSVFRDRKLAWAILSGVEGAGMFVSGRSGLACRLSGTIYCWAPPVSASVAASLTNSTCALVTLSCSLRLSCLVRLSSNLEEMADCTPSWDLWPLPLFEIELLWRLEMWFNEIDLKGNSFLMLLTHDCYDMEGKQKIFMPCSDH